MSQAVSHRFAKTSRRLGHAGHRAPRRACGKRHADHAPCTACQKKRAARLPRDGGEPQQNRTVPPLVREVLRTPGVPLSAAVRATFELRFGPRFQPGSRAQRRPGGSRGVGGCRPSVHCGPPHRLRRGRIRAALHRGHPPPGPRADTCPPARPPADLSSERLELAPEGDCAERERRQSPTDSFTA